jgi:hypothetical protein
MKIDETEDTAPAAGIEGQPAETTAEPAGEPQLAEAGVVIDTTEPGNAAAPAIDLNDAGPQPEVA